MSKTIFAWHVHHEILVEPLTEPIENRIAYIRAHKPRYEIPTRLRLLKVVKGELPTALIGAGKAYDEAGKAYVKAWAAYDEAGKAYVKAWAAYDEAGKAYDEARAAYDEALETCRDEILALHAQECPDCPWDGKTIFPKGKP